MPLGRVMVVNFVQPENAPAPIDVTLFGISRDSILQPANASSPMDSIPYSKARSVILQQPPNALVPLINTLPGIFMLPDKLEHRENV